MSPQREAARGRLLIIGATVFWGLSGTLARYIFRDLHVPPFSLVELRLAIALLVLGPWLAWRSPQAFRIGRADLGYFLVLGLVGVAAVQGSYYYAVSTLGVGLAILIQYLAPAIIVGWDALRGRRVDPRTLAAVLGALAGTVLLVEGRGLERVAAGPLAWLAAFLSAFVFAFSMVYSKRGVHRYHPGAVQFYSFLVGFAVWAVVTPPWRILSRGYDARTWLIFAVVGTCSTLIPVALFLAGLRRMSASQAAVMCTLEPVVAIFSSAVFLGEGLGPGQWIGAILVLAASALASSRARELTPEHA